MASQMVSQRDQEDLQNAFRQVDKNGDGTLSKQELIEAFSNAMESQGKVVDGRMD
jgi:calcium-dependent protein kinase